MGFSGLMGFASGAARAGEQVMDANIARLDAAGVARAKEEAQLRLEERTEKAAIAREGRGYAHEESLYARGRADKVTDTETDLVARRLAEKEAFDLSVDPSRRGLMTGAKNEDYKNSVKDQDNLALDKQKAGSHVEGIKLQQAGEDRRSNAKLAADKLVGKDTLPREKFQSDQVSKATKAFFVLSGGTVNEITGAMDAQSIKDRGALARGMTAVETLSLQGMEGNKAAELIFTKTASEQNDIIKSADAATQKKAEEMANRTIWDRVSGSHKEGRPLDPTPNAPKQESKAPAIPDKTALKGGEEANGYVWNAKTGRAEPVKPAAPAKPRGLMPEAGAATMPQSTPETLSLAERSAAAKQRMDELTKNTSYASREERDAARKHKAVQLKSEIAPGSTPAPTSTTTDLAPIGLTATGAKVEAAYQALLNKDVSAIEFAKSLGTLLNDPEFRNNHPDLVKRYKIYQSEAAGEVSKGSR